MALDENFAAAFIDGGSGRWVRTRILGVRVRPLCLWHKLLLNSIDSPLVNKGRVTLWDLRVGVGICRLRFGDSRIRKPWLVPTWIFVKAILAGIFRRDKPDDKGRNAIQRGIVREVEKFLSYSGDYLQFPEYAVIPSKHGTSISRGSAPDELEHVGDLVRWSRWDEAYIWEMPIGRANWYRALARRDAGLDIDFVDEAEKKFQEQLPPEFRHN